MAMLAVSAPSTSASAPSNRVQSAADQWSEPAAFSWSGQQQEQHEAPFREAEQVGSEEIDTLPAVLNPVLELQLAELRGSQDGLIPEQLPSVGNQVADSAMLSEPLNRAVQPSIEGEPALLATVVASTSGWGTDPVLTGSAPLQSLSGKPVTGIVQNPELPIEAVTLSSLPASDLTRQSEAKTLNPLTDAPVSAQQTVHQQAIYQQTTAPIGYQNVAALTPAVADVQSNATGQLNTATQPLLPTAERPLDPALFTGQTAPVLAQTINTPIQAAAVVLPSAQSAALPLFPTETQTVNTDVAALATSSGHQTGAVWRGESLQAAAQAGQLGQRLLHLLADKTELQLGLGLQRATIRLDPPSLGAVELSITVDGDKLSVQLHSSVSQTRELMAQGLEQLRAQLQQKLGMDVQLQLQSGEGQSGQPQRQWGGEADITQNSAWLDTETETSEQQPSGLLNQLV